MEPHGAHLVRASAKELVALIEKVRQMVDIEKTNRADTETVDVVSVLSPILEAFREDYPETTVSVDAPEEASAAVVSERALAIALQNLVENTVEHNDTSALTVDVTVATDGQQTEVRVTDDGSGLPETEREVLRNHTETPLQHSSGLGLWLTYWVVSATGGDVSVEASGPRGTTITLTLPTQDSSTVGVAARPAYRKAAHESP